MKIVNLPNQGLLGLGPYVQFTEEEHAHIDEALALRERMIKEFPDSGLYGNLINYFSTGAIRDSLHPVWLLIKEGAGNAGKAVNNEAP